MVAVRGQHAYWSGTTEVGDNVAGYIIKVGWLAARAMCGGNIK